MRRILMAVALCFMTGNLIGCGGDAEKAPTKVNPDAPKPPGEPEGGKP